MNHSKKNNLELDYEVIGLNIREHRKNCGLSQELLAEMAEISTAHMSHIETGNTKLSLPALFSISRALECSLDELINPTKEFDPEDRANFLRILLSDCSKQEAAILIEIIKNAKKALRMYL